MRLTIRVMPALADGEQVRLAASASRKNETRLRFKGAVSPLALMEAEPASPLARFLRWLHGLWVIRPVPQSMRAMASGETSWLSPDLSNFAAWFQDADKGGQVLLISHHPRVIDLFAARNGYWLDRKGAGPVKAERVAINDSDIGVPVSDLVARGWIHG